MAQHDYVLDNQGFGAMRSDLNLALAAIASGNSGNTAPSTVYPGLAWLDTSGTPWLVKQYNGTQWVTLYSINATTHQSDIVRGGTDSKLTSTTALASILNLQAITYAAATAITAAATTNITNTTDNIDLAGSAVTVTAITAPAALIGRRIRVRVTGSNITVTNGGGITVPNGVSASFNAGDVFTLVITAANTVRIEGVVTANFTGGLFQIAATAAGNALTGTLNPCQIDFRSATLTSGAFVRRSVTSPISLVAPNGASFGLFNGQQSTLYLLAIDNAGTVELAFVNPQGFNLDETTLISTTAISAGSTSAGVAYSTTARTNVPFRVVGLITSTQATAGTWATQPTLVAGAGGLAGVNAGSLGFTQAYTDVTRNFGTTYYNTTGRVIKLTWGGTASTVGNNIAILVNGGYAAMAGVQVGGQYLGVSAEIPPNASYSISITAGTPTVTFCRELR
jgi:hypothetical protein